MVCYAITFPRGPALRAFYPSKDCSWICSKRCKGEILLFIRTTTHCRSILALCQIHGHHSKVYITSRSQKACDETAKELNSFPTSSSFAQPRGTCISIPADLQNLSEVNRLVNEVEEHELAGRSDKKGKAKIHVLVNNAGAAWGEDIDDYAVSLHTCLHLPLHVPWYDLQ